MIPKYHKLQRGILLTLFTISGAYSLYNPHVFKTAVLSLIGIIAYDIVCYLKVKSEPKNYDSVIEEMKLKHDQTYSIIKEMKDDVSIAKLANSFRSR